MIMEQMILQNPALLVFLLGGFITGLVWLIRLESKVNANEKGIAKMEQSAGDLWDELERHRSNDTVHFNVRVAAEIERRQDERFKNIEEQLREIKALVKSLDK